MNKYMTIDVETTGLDWTTERLHGFSVGYSEDDATYYRINQVPEQVRRDLADPSIAKIGQNFHSFDAKYLLKSGFELKGEIDELMVVWNLIDPDSKLGLKYLAEQEFGPESLEKKRRLDKYLQEAGCRHIGELCAKDLLDPAHPHTPIIAEYCCEDNLNTTRLFFRGMAKLEQMDKTLKANFGFKKSPLDYYYEEARPLEKVLLDMEYRGIRINLDVIESIRASALESMAVIEAKLTPVFSSQIAIIENELCEKLRAEVTSPEAKAKRQPGKGKAKFSWGNNNHFGKLLYQLCELPDHLIFRTEKGKYKTDKSTLEFLSAQLPKNSWLVEQIRLFAEYKKHVKIASTYTGNNKKGIYSKLRFVEATDDGRIIYRDPGENRIARIFPQYVQTSGTGRLKSKNPNTQNLKRDSDVKKFFIPDDPSEVFDDADYSQIELRVGAHLSQDPGLVSAYLGGEDVHIRTASRLFGKTVTKENDLERQAGKRTNFLTIFDGGPRRLQQALKADTGKDFEFDECVEFIRVWFETYPQVRAYLDAQIDFFKRYKFCISEFGRIRRLPDIVYGNKLRWIKDRVRDRWVPRYEGPIELRNQLVHRIKKKNPKLPMEKITDEMVGWEASKRYKHAIKAGLNQPIQGYAASLMKRTMVALYNDGRKIANQVHDQVLVPRQRGDFASRDKAVATMRDIYKMTVPIEVDVKTVNSFHPKDRSDD